MIKLVFKKNPFGVYSENNLWWVQRDNRESRKEGQPQLSRERRWDGGMDSAGSRGEEAVFWRFALEFDKQKEEIGTFKVN